MSTVGTKSTLSDIFAQDDYLTEWMTTVGVYNKARANKRIRRDPKRRGVYKRVM